MQVEKAKYEVLVYVTESEGDTIIRTESGADLVELKESVPLIIEAVLDKYRLFGDSHVEVVTTCDGEFFNFEEFHVRVNDNGVIVGL